MGQWHYPSLNKSFIDTEQVAKFYLDFHPASSSVQLVTERKDLTKG